MILDIEVEQGTIGGGAAGDIIELPDASVTVGGVTYVPFVDPHGGRVGYAVRTYDEASREEFIYLNPSDHTGDGTPNVFAYRGEENDPAFDEPLCHFTVAEDWEV